MTDEQIEAAVRGAISAFVDQPYNDNTHSLMREAVLAVLDVVAPAPYQITLNVTTMGEQTHGDAQ